MYFKWSRILISMVFHVTSGRAGESILPSGQGCVRPQDNAGEQNS